MGSMQNFFQNRSLGIYFALFLSGAAVLAYQAMGLRFVGDSVNFLCLLFLLYGLGTRHWKHILENSMLMTAGYILPLLIRNSMKLTYHEAPSVSQFLQLAAVSSSMTLAMGLGCSALSFLVFRILGRQMRALGKTKITTRNFDQES
jgi:hypothetical protein